ncbi:MAG: HPr(Ser) kinase/phosphatase [Deltaproteobacteria bacterium RIFCSPLOWO2_02_FULL_50_16]|nr:MAG: HPr(Ser) kinase/phosphatase [Deltaproteobacteria bacterium RIFCSPHIGHO2_02_FULL_50_15]OGQ56057.1 MAG: HPr(Ser) kinase/phosphatase [Deltaproteobacteria bacterium RIFCSPLOWO2_02_FULL_50_16]OGQ68325.1 MAG: HPr(Ser) kinase/phosphatase [Deltaproteobacteria bacterium RIFCSPLOWO2_12_FULL_50_11]
MICIPVSSLLKSKDLSPHLKCITGENGLNKKIYIPYIQKPGLALAGDTSHIHTGRVQIFGNSEVRYVSKQASPDRKKYLKRFCSSNITCIIVSHNNKPPDDLIRECTKYKIPLMVSKLSTSTFINKITKFLSENLTPSTTIHGVLVDIYGIGVLILGKSGIGKSETALELITHGHRLVADDIVNIKKKPPSSIYGMGSELIKYHMEIRGLGIINIKDLFGVSSVRDQKLIELVIELVDWNENTEYERLGVTENKYRILDVPLPFLKVPVRPGRSLTTIIGVAARNQLLKIKGYHSAMALQEKLTRKLLSGEELDSTTQENVE